MGKSLSIVVIISLLLVSCGYKLQSKEETTRLVLEQEYEYALRQEEEYSTFMIVLGEIADDLRKSDCESALIDITGGVYEIYKLELWYKIDSVGKLLGKEDFHKYTSTIPNQKNHIN